MRPLDSASAFQRSCQTALPGVVVAGLLLGACNTTEIEVDRLSLLSPAHRADVITESEVLQPQMSLTGNRFTSGWWPFKKDGSAWLAAVGTTARLEGVSLAKSTRLLRLEGEVLEAPDGASIEISVAGLAHAILPLVFPLEIDLPVELPLGRFPIDLELPKGVQVAVRAGAITGALPAGTVTAEIDALSQQGYSIVDYLLPVASGAIFATTFEPPTDPRDAQAFEIWIEPEGGALEKVFAWPPAAARRQAESNRLQLPLAEGLTRLRFLALGDGPAGTWIEPSIITPKQPESPVEVGRLPIPKLVLVYVMDALRADYLGHLGGPADVSPTLDRLATEGATLLDHYSVAPNTLPSIKALFLGHTLRTRGGWKVPIEGPKTLAERFGQAGYLTALFSGNGYASDTYGTARGFDFVDHDVVLDPTRPVEYHDNGEVIHEALLDWLDGVPRDRNIFTYVQTLHPHNPYMPPAHLVRKFTAGIDSRITGGTGVLQNIKQNRLQPTAADKERIKALYAASVRYNDDLIAELLEALEKRYAPGEVLFIATADHGDELFDHGGVLHGYTLYEEQIHVPAIFWWPGVIDPCRLDTPSDHLDLQLTLRALFEQPSASTESGRSLWPEITRCRSLVAPDHLRFVAAASLQRGLFLVRSGNLKYIWAPRQGQGGGAGRSKDGEYLFDLAADPEEMHNLAGMRSLRADWLRAELLAWVERDGARADDQEEAEINDEERRRLEALGYID